MVANLIVGGTVNNTIQGGDSADLIYGYDPTAEQTQVGSIAATLIATGLEAPIFAGAPPDDPTKLFILEREGRIDILDLRTGQIQNTPFLDISAEVTTEGEGGLAGLAFHPNYSQNGLFYVYFTNENDDSVIRSYHVSPADPTHAEIDSARAILTVDQPDGSFNHKGGWLGFGPDGQLYAGLGDGGGDGDPFNNAQDTGTLLGKIIRINVDTDGFPLDPARNYAIPADNPFADGSGAPEVWAFGLRNPFRDSFDRATGDLYIADVGQDAWEEIDIGVRGGNYGWRVFEGPAVFAGGTPTGGAAIGPTAWYSHEVGHTVIGGYVYRGESEGLQGQYFLADFIDDKIWTLGPDATNHLALTERTAQVTPDHSTIDNPVSFGEDATGNLYLLDLDGDVFRLTPQINVADGNDLLMGGGGNDFIFGGSGDDTLSGQVGADGLHGQSGSDLLLGGPGDDRLYGGAGNDRLVGGPGNDVLFGGGGSDVFAFEPGSGLDIIADFTHGQDVIELPRSLAADFAAVLNRSQQIGANAIINIDAADAITLPGVALSSLTAGDFLFV